MRPRVVLLLYLKTVGAVAVEQLNCLKFLHGSYLSLILDMMVRAANLHSSLTHSGGWGWVEHSSAFCEGQSLCDWEGAVLIRNMMGEMTKSEVTMRVTVVKASLCRVVERRMKMHGAHNQQPITLGAWLEQED